jgi:hypothetical protein
MREKRRGVPAPAPIRPDNSDQVLAALAQIEREIARIQKKLGMDFTWYKAK